MQYHRLWERLLDYLNEWASVREVQGGIEVTFQQSSGLTRTVELVMTSADWDDYVSTSYGTGDPRATTLRREVLATPDWAHYLVYDTYDFVPSERRELPEEDLDPGPGEWMVTDDVGNAIERFRDFGDGE